MVNYITEADYRYAKYLNSIMRNTQVYDWNDSRDIGDVRPVYEDGTPSHYYFITQVFEEYIRPERDVILTLRPIAWKSAIKEILWIYQDQSNDLDLLRDKYGITWWDSWDIGDRTIGNRYGYTVKKHRLMDKLLYDLKNSPNGRRHIMNLFQASDLDESPGLYPCAMETQWSVTGNKENKYLNLTLIQRSSDYLVANHINKIQYVALQMMVAKHCGYKVGKFCHYVNNLHIYDRHIESIEKILYNDEPDKSNSPAPRLVLDTDKTNFYDFTIDDFKMENYDPYRPNVKFELAI